MKGIPSFKGNAREALNFYASIFVAEPPSFFLFKDMPAQGQAEAQETQPAVDPDWVMNGIVEIGYYNLLASDTAEEFMNGEKGFSAGNNFTLSWVWENAAEVKTVWRRFVQAGAKTITPLEGTFWAKQYGFLVDQLGIQGMIQEWSREQEG